MSAWGGSSSAKSCDALLQRVERDDPQLTELVILPIKNFGSAQVERLAVALETKNHHLQTLAASGHALSTAALLRLGRALGSPQSPVQNVAIGDSNMGDEGVLALLQGIGASTSDNRPITGLRVVDLSFKNIGSKGCRALVEQLSLWKHLNILNLSRNERIVESPGCFDNHPKPIFPHLQELDLSECNLDAHNLQSLVTALQPLDPDRQLRLKLHHNPCMGQPSDASAWNTLFSLLDQSSIAELHLSNCHLDDAALQQFANVIRSKKADLGLHTLDISQNDVTADGILDSFVASFSSVLKLQHLNLSGNQLGSKAVEALAQALPKLQMLDLSATNCGAAGAVAMVECNQVTQLRLFDNQLGSDGFCALATALLHQQVLDLETLDVAGNAANQEAVVALLQAIQRIPANQCSLKLLVIGGNEGGANVEAAIREVQKVHPDLDVARDKQKKATTNDDDVESIPMEIRQFMKR